jgi:hypothetical protein
MKHFTFLIVLFCLLSSIKASATGGPRSRNKPSTSCTSDSYSSEILKEEKISETCTAYEIKVTYDGTKTAALSHYSMAIPCGEVKDLSNSENWKMVLGKDRTTGVYGLKIDDISGFGDRGADSFTIKFTWCSSSTCEKELGVVAYKYARCVSYDTLSNGGNNPEPPQTCSSLIASIEKKNVTCAAGNDGTLGVVVQEGQRPITYSWSNGSSDSTALNLTAGLYAVTVKDAKGNTLTLTEQITAPAPITIAESVINPSCSGVANGSINLTVTGGVGSYNYSWSNGSIEQNQSNLIGGLYTVTVSDSLGCSVQKTFMLSNMALITVESALSQPSCIEANGTINLTVAGGVAPYTYRWNNGATTEDLQNLGAGNYRVRITDALGCTVDKVYSLAVKNTLVVIYTVVPVSCQGGNTGAIDLSVYGGTAPYTIKWLDGPTTEDRSGLTEGSYQVTVTDAAGCSRPLSLSINRKPLEVTSVINQPTCAGDQGSISVAPVGGVPPYSYSWSNGSTGSSVDGLANGIYSVTVTDASGCSNTLYFGIFSPSAIEVTSAIKNEQCGSAGTFGIDLSVMGGKYPYTYSWSNGASSQNVTGLAAGTYTVNINDAGGCTVTKQFVLDAAALNWSCLINPVIAPVVCKSVGNKLSTGVSGATSFQWTVSSTDNSWSITSGAADSAAVYTAGNPGTTATFTLSIVKNGCTQTCSYTVSSGCVVRDNTGGGDPSSSEPCTTSPTVPPVVVTPEPQPEPEKPTHGCGLKIVSAYPNPFKDKVKFEWEAAANDNVKLEIFDGHGNKVKTIYQGAVTKGQRYSHEWSVNSGGDRYYYFRYTSSKGVDHGKLVKR